MKYISLLLLFVISANAQSVTSVDCKKAMPKVTTSGSVVTVSCSSVTPTPTPSTSGNAELPRTILDTSPTTQTGATINVSAGENLQQALDMAVPGDSVVLAAGATFIAPDGGFILKAKNNPENKWIVVRGSSAFIEGTRVVGSQFQSMPKLLTNNTQPALSTQQNTSFYRILGIEISLTTSAIRDDTDLGDPTVYNLVALGSDSETDNEKQATDLIIDHCYIHGLPTKNVRRGIALNSKRTAIVDSYVSEIHEHGADSQAIGGWNGAGAFKIVNNYLEASGENFMLGGATASIKNLVASDVEFKYNYLFKPQTWNFHNTAAFTNVRWSVKNLFELKNAQRILIEGNVLEGNWLDAQAGMSVLFTPRSEDGAMPWAVVQDVTFVNNKIKNVSGGINILGTDYPVHSQVTKRIVIQNNSIEGIGAAINGGSGRVFQVLDSPQDITISHNTVISDPQSFGQSVVMEDAIKSNNFIFTDNIVISTYGVTGTGTAEGTATLEAYASNYKFTGNVLVGRNINFYPTGNFFPAKTADVGFTDNYTTLLYKTSGVDYSILNNKLANIK